MHVLKLFLCVSPIQTARQKDFLIIHATLDLSGKMYRYFCILNDMRIWEFGYIDKFQIEILDYDFHLQKSTMSSLVPDGTWRCYLSAFVYVCMLRFWASLVQSPVQQCSNDLYL